MTMEAQEVLRESAMIDRRRAVEDLIRNAKRVGANGVIGLSFHSTPVSQNCHEVSFFTSMNLSPLRERSGRPTF